MSEDKSHKQTVVKKGPIAWMAQNNVAANLLMMTFIAGGLIVFSTVKQEVFPEFDLDMVQITVPYPGASPDEIEEGIILAIEEEVHGLDGVKRVTSMSAEGVGSVNVELLRATDPNKLLQDIKNAIDRIRSFPEEAERVKVRLLSMRHDVITMVVYGDQEEKTLRKLGEKIRYELLQKPNITQAEIDGIRPVEITVEMKQETLRSYNLTLGEVASKIKRAALDLPAGGVKTKKGEILLRTTERRNKGNEFKDIVILSKPDGTEVQLGDIANIIDGFTDSDQEAFYNGKRAVMIKVFRVGDQTPQEVANAVKEYVRELKTKLPGGVNAAILYDRSKILQQRIILLLKNFMMGLVLVLVLLGMFLDPRLAFWVMLGIPISILGSFLFIKPMDVSVNMISLFAFIITLGIIVDDAIIVGENVYEFRQRGGPFLRGAIKGTREVITPITFSILTNIAAFLPLLFVPGISGKYFKVIPVTVIAVFLVSWIECIFVLPSHLGHQKPYKKKGAFLKLQGKIANLLLLFRDKTYAPFLIVCAKYRYLTAATGITALAVAIGFVTGGHIDFTFLPKIDGDRVTANAVLPYGIDIAETKKVEKKLIKSAREVAAQFKKGELIQGIFSMVGGSFSSRRSSGGRGSHLASVRIFLVDPEKRAISSSEFTKRWRIHAGGIPGLERLSFSYSAGGSPGSPIDIQLSHPDMKTLEKAASELARMIHDEYEGVKDIDDGYSRGKPQFNLKVSPEAQSLGINASDLARQVRSFYYGAEALRQQRGRDEIKVMVKLPKNERRSEYYLENLLVRTPKGGEIPFGEAAEIKKGYSYTKINRADRRRVLNVTADVIKGVTNANKVIAKIKEKDMPLLKKKYNGLTFSFEGERREQRESLSALWVGFALVMFGIYALLAIPFKSYIQPVIVMTSIPFGIVGAILGHIIMGYNLSIISLMGIVALSGVVVNDSLVLIDYANRKREQGKSHFEAIFLAGTRRFRPILLTSLTTFFGLAPMIFETSVQARFLVPMAISLGFGILFATVIALLLVPSLYLIVNDLKNLVASYLRNFGFFKEPQESQESQEPC